MHSVIVVHMTTAYVISIHDYCMYSTVHTTLKKQLKMHSCMVKQALGTVIHRPSYSWSAQRCVHLCTAMEHRC